MTQDLQFILSGGGKMARLIRDHDWSSTPVGGPERWPISLRTLVQTIVAAPQPMVLMWGPELVQFYNDDFSRILEASGGHPAALGSRCREFWKDIWDVTGPQIEGVMAGEGTVVQEQVLIPMPRDGHIEDVYWDYGYSPAFDDEGRVAGVLVTCRETTEEVRIREYLEERESLVTIAGELARFGGWRVDLETGISHWSDEVCRIHEVPLGSTPTPEEGIQFYAPEYRETIRTRFTRCAVEGEPFDLELQIVTARGKRIWVRALGEPIRDAEGHIREVQGAFQDITYRKETEAALAESERRFRELAESMPLIVWTALPSGEVDYQSSAVLDFTGKTRDELKGEGWLDVLHPDDRDSTVAAWTRSVQSGDPYEIQFRIRRHDGAYHWHLNRAVPLRNDDGEIVKWFGSSTDIHDQLEVEREAHALSQRMARTLESMSDAFLLLDHDWNILFINAVGEELVERAREELLGRNLWEEFPEAVGSTFEVEYRRAQETGKPTSIIEYFPPLERWLNVRTFPSDDGLAIYFRDVTADREDRNRLREQAELLDRAQDAILVRDLEHRIVYWNAGAERIYGWKVEEARDRSIRELLYSDPAIFDEATRTVLEQGEWSGELQHLRDDGTTITVEGRWSLVRNDAGEPWRILAINTDITERKRLLSQFLRAQRLESIGTLAGGIAHDLNNVLAPILLSIGMLREEIRDQELQEILETIESSAERGASMVKQVLAFARGVDGARVLVDLRRIVSDLERVVVDTFPKGIDLRKEVPEDLWPLVGDPTQIHQVLMNLLVNARDALPQGGLIRIGAENAELDEHFAAMSSDASPGSYVCLSVIDSGVGMPPEVVEQIFDPFFTTKGVGEGTGLGLSTVAAILRSHGGFVNVYSEPGSGTTFRLYFPAEPDGVSEEETRTASSLPRGNGECVLVVDDERSVREVTRQTLEAFGYRVVTATDGADALSIYGRRKDEIDLVLTDIMMPVMDGPAATRALRRLNAKVKVIAASGLGASGGVTQAVESGIEQFLPKPYTAETLLRTIHEVLHPEDG